MAFGFCDLLVVSFAHGRLNSEGCCTSDLRSPSDGEGDRFEGIVLVRKNKPEPITIQDIIFFS